ncbi:MAG TPA: exodeoxyribonuclease V subunit alpha [Kineosporiaceae bacterium]|nr:exodeoxyribonuclease V subunit alpha [Kineosporiaceae bacterium]
MTSARLVQRAKGLLKVFNVAGVLEAADVQVAIRLGTLGGEPAESVLLAAALTVRAVRLGSVCVDLARLSEVAVDDPEVILTDLPWPDPIALEAALRASPLVNAPVNGRLTPLRLVDTDSATLLYLDRYWRQEQIIRAALAERDLTRPPVTATDRLAERLAKLFPGPAPDRQRIGAALAATRWTTVLAGGPGTGKTHTVARVLKLLERLDQPSLRIALAAPTGKAAARLQEAVREQAGELELPELSAMTLHRLLGWRPNSTTRFKHDAGNHLPYDVVVLDESSMVSLTMMARLLEALRPQTRLILVGDPDQLTSVDAGAVLGDLVARPVTAEVDEALVQLVGADLDLIDSLDSAVPADDLGEAALSEAERSRLGAGIVRLSRGRRFGGAIAELAVAVRTGDADRALELLHAGGPLSLTAPGSIGAVQADLIRADSAVRAAASAGDIRTALAHLEDHRLLCAHREGPFGVREWDRLASGWVSAPFDEWYPGQPLLVTANDYEAKVYNGDTGVVVALDGALVAAFGQGDAPVLLPPTLLASIETVHAMTIHRSQGSQYDTVSVVLPPVESSLLTRELLYTAVTRARKQVRLLGTDEAFRAGVNRRVLRASGLQRQVRAVSGA